MCTALVAYYKNPYTYVTFEPTWTPFIRSMPDYPTVAREEELIIFFMPRVPGELILLMLSYMPKCVHCPRGSSSHHHEPVVCERCGDRCERCGITITVIARSFQRIRDGTAILRYSS